MKIVIFIEMVLSIYLLDKKPFLALWFLAHWSLWFLFNYGNERIYRETLNSYPDTDRVIPRYFSFVWKPLFLISDKPIPREIYLTDLFLCIVFLVYTLFLLLVNSENMMVISKCYFTLFIASLIVSRVIVAWKSFIIQYKKISTKNIRYFFDTDDRDEPRFVGKCEVVCVSYKPQKIIATVIVDTNKIVDRVIIEKNDFRGKNEYYNLYELHGVYYVE